jgi:hypothetical protein
VNDTPAYSINNRRLNRFGAICTIDCPKDALGCHEPFNKRSRWDSIPPTLLEEFLS